MAEMLYSVDFEPWAAPLRQAARQMRDLRPALDDVGELLEGITRRNIEDSGGPIHWPDLSEATLIERARHPSGPERGAPRQVFSSRRSVGPASSREARVLAGAGRSALTKGARKVVETAKPLIWTRALLRSITHAVGSDYVDVGSTLEKAWTLFLGSRPGKKPVVPARNPYGLTSTDKASIVGIFVRHILGGLVRGRA